MGDTAVCQLQTAVFLSIVGGSVGVIPVLARGLAKGTSSEGGVEGSRAGGNKDKLGKDVSGETDGGIGVVKEDLKR